MAIRLDRLATLYVFHPLAVRVGDGILRTPILMYHSISDSGGARHPYYETATSPERFAEQMRYLSELGYEAIRLSEAAEFLAQRRPGTVKPVVITFDDGYRDFYTRAFPVLATYGFTANVFLPTAYIAESRASFLGMECMNWSEVRELDAAGIEFGSHTVNHPKLKDLHPEAVDQEVLRSKATIEDKLGRAVSTFSYPYAFPETNRPFVERLRATLIRSGYQTGVSTVIGTAGPSQDRFFLPRLPVNTADDLILFKAKLDGGYDWLHGLQRLKKAAGGVAR